MRQSTGLAIAVGLAAAPAVAETFNADVWADNWFSLYIDGEMVAEDSVSITTERSFNAESFSFEAERPFVIGLYARDFKENDTGLEYIGSNRQQMGDGGVILQITNAAGELVVVSDDGWRCLVTHQAPLDKSCESEDNPVAGSGACSFNEIDVPEGWAAAGYDDSGWVAANLYSESEVSPKMGYDEIDWHKSAQLIWGSDLETDNSLLCRKTIA